MKAGRKKRKPQLYPVFEDARERRGSGNSEKLIINMISFLGLSCLLWGIRIFGKKVSTLKTVVEFIKKQGGMNEIHPSLCVLLTLPYKSQFLHIGLNSDLKLTNFNLRAGGTV